MKKQEVYNELLNDVKNECKKIGINAEFAIVTGKNYRGEEYQYIKSSSFKTMPKMFDEIHVEGRIWESAFEEIEGYHYITVDLHYCYTLPTCGQNGHDFGRIQYEITNDTNEIDDKFIEMPKND